MPILVLSLILIKPGSVSVKNVKPKYVLRCLEGFLDSHTFAILPECQYYQRCRKRGARGAAGPLALFQGGQRGQVPCSIL